MRSTMPSARTAVFRHLARLPANTSVVLTNVVVRGGSGLPEENWRALLELARARCCGLYAVTLACEPEGFAKRIMSEDRVAFRKVRNPAVLATVMAERALFDDGATGRTIIDDARLSPDACAVRIATWLSQASRWEASYSR